MSNKGIKHDSEKVRLDLLDSYALNEVGKVLTFGANKYAAHNWRNGMAWSRLLGAALRHLLAFLSGENLDPETGLSHLAHCMCCLMFVLNYSKTKIDLDDRHKEDEIKEKQNPSDYIQDLVYKENPYSCLDHPKAELKQEKYENQYGYTYSTITCTVCHKVTGIC